MRRLLRFFVAAIIFLSCQTIKAQQLEQTMQVYADSFPQEKIYVHFDKSLYNPGETIWFKVYLQLNGMYSFISKNIYTELIDPSGNVIDRKVSPVVESSGAASFDVPANTTASYLHFRAYTTWMLNFDTAFLFDKDIPLINKKASDQKRNTANTYSLQFFPEGGDMVEGVETRVAFKANDQSGLPINVKGIIKDKAGKQVATFTSAHDGMGMISITPLPGEEYTATWTTPQNKQQTTKLPAAQKTGLTLGLDYQNQILKFTVKRPENLPDERKTVNIMAHLRQEMIYKARINLSKSNKVTSEIPLENVPSGILQVTLFDAAWQPLAERIVFVNNHEYESNAYMTIGVKNLEKRTKNVIQVEVPDTFRSNLSIAITDADINAPSPSDDNIISRLLLTSDIRGYVHQPGYYFSGYADSLSAHLDLVMMTHGWRRFNWSDLARGIKPTIKYWPESYLPVKGEISGIEKSKLPTNDFLNLILKSKDSGTRFLNVPVTRDGLFTIDDAFFYDTVNVFYQFNKNKDLTDRINLNISNGFYKGSRIVNLSGAGMATTGTDSSVIKKNISLMDEYRKMLATRDKKAKLLQEVVVTAKQKTRAQELDDKYASGLFSGGINDRTFVVMDDPLAVGSLSVFNYLQGKVAGLQISGGGATPSVTWRGGSPGFYLNEMPVDAQTISTVNMSDVALVKVMPPPFLGGAGGSGANGAIAVYTKKGGDNKNENVKGLAKIRLAGYSPVKEFYKPDYSVYAPEHDLDDLRSTLLWEPFVLLDKQQKRATVTFYNNDVTKRFRVVIEGMTAEGRLTRIEEIIK